ncbi:MAG TPA: Uma2 family endonuclease [Kofleriaceae bacterium]|nr:Uma2 family endonuclease [Kofleriaceae bacterium]
MSSPGSVVSKDLPAVDDRLAAPETRYVIDDGKLVYVAPADEPHAACHANLTALLVAYVAAEYGVAMDMLTRTSRTDDIAPDVSVFPRARDPVTGGRRLEQLAFEVVSTQSLADAGRKADKLVSRGVRRCLAVDVERARAFEWSRELGTWSILDRNAYLHDPVFAVPLPIAALIETAKADPTVRSAMLAALIAQGDPVIAAETARSRAEGKAEGLAAGLLELLALRGLQPQAHERARILAERDLGRLQRWYARALTCDRVPELLDAE